MEEKKYLPLADTTRHYIITSLETTLLRVQGDWDDYLDTDPDTRSPEQLIKMIATLETRIETAIDFLKN